MLSMIMKEVWRAGRGISERECKRGEAGKRREKKEMRIHVLNSVNSENRQHWLVRAYSKC